MTAITTTHAEWAVVDRLRAILAEPPHAQYNVTQAYGLCVAILAWVMQRIRTPMQQARSPEAIAACVLADELKEMSFRSSPFSVATDSVSGFSDDLKVFDFLVWLRDASSHGDARNVTAINNGHNLVGFRCKARCQGKLCSSNLKEEDLRRIGAELATRYCNALKNASQNSIQFTADAQTVSEGVTA